MFQLIAHRTNKMNEELETSAVYLCKGFCEDCLIRFECYTRNDKIIITEKVINKIRKKKMPLSMFGGDIEDLSCEEHDCGWCILSNVCTIEDNAETYHKEIQANGGSIRRKKRDHSWQYQISKIWKK